MERRIPRLRDGRSVPASTEAEAPLRAPSRAALLREVRVALEYARLRLGWARLVRGSPRGDGSPVVVVPGFATDDGWTVRLRMFLAEIGWSAHGWDLGRNTGNVWRIIPRLIDRVAEVSSRSGARPVRLVGWSLGGYLVREVARECPSTVDRVVTLGAPVVGGPKYTASAPAYVRRGYDLDRIEAEALQREADPIRVPVGAVFSRGDGVVAWRACIDRFSPEVEHHEVRTSHLGLIVAPQVYRLLADLLGPSGGGAGTA